MCEQSHLLSSLFWRSSVGLFQTSLHSLRAWVLVTWVLGNCNPVTSSPVPSYSWIQKQQLLGRKRWILWRPVRGGLQNLDVCRRTVMGIAPPCALGCQGRSSTSFDFAILLLLTWSDPAVMAQRSGAQIGVKCLHVWWTGWSMHWDLIILACTWSSWNARFPVLNPLWYVAGTSGSFHLLPASSLV